MKKRQILTLLMAAAIGVGGWVASPGAAVAGQRDRNYSGHSYGHAPVCRDFSRVSFQYGHLRQSVGTACLRRDGNWYVVNENSRAPYMQQRMIFAGDHNNYGGQWNGYRGRDKPYYQGDRNRYNDRGGDHRDFRDHDGGNHRNGQRDR